SNGVFAGNGCHAKNGGAIYFSGTNLEMTDNIVNDCSATTAGGVIYNDGGTVTLSGTQFGGVAANHAEQGGVIYSNGGTIKNSTAANAKSNVFNGNFAGS